MIRLQHVIVVQYCGAEGETVLPRNLRQEALSIAYVRAIAARCGLAVQVGEADLGIDLSLRDVRRRDHGLFDTGFPLDIQAKSTTLGRLTATHLVYDLRVKNYDDLRDNDVGAPRLLVVLVLPQVEGQWTDQSEDCLVLRHAAYWVSLRGMGKSINQHSVRVRIPRANLLTVTALHKLMDKIRRREWQ